MEKRRATLKPVRMRKETAIDLVAGRLSVAVQTASLNQRPSLPALESSRHHDGGRICAIGPDFFELLDGFTIDG